MKLSVFSNAGGGDVNWIEALTLFGFRAAGGWPEWPLNTNHSMMTNTKKSADLSSDWRLNVIRCGTGGNRLKCGRSGRVLSTFTSHHFLQQEYHDIIIKNKLILMSQYQRIRTDVKTSVVSSNFAGKMETVWCLNMCVHANMRRINSVFTSWYWP